MATNKRDLSSQRMLQDSYDTSTGVLGLEGLGYDGTGNPLRIISKEVATKVTVSGSITYVAKATIGTAQSAAVWQAKSIDTTTGVVITWADGNANFDNVATDLTALSYS